MVAPIMVGRRKLVNPQFWINVEITLDRDRRTTSASPATLRSVPVVPPCRASASQNHEGHQGPAGEGDIGLVVGLISHRTIAVGETTGIVEPCWKSRVPSY
jgi:hypothetical protein